MNPSQHFQVLQEFDHLIREMSLLRVQLTRLEWPASPRLGQSDSVNTLAGCLSHYAHPVTGSESPRDLAWTEAMYEKHPRH